jgi:hypothetical protein
MPSSAGFRLLQVAQLSTSATRTSKTDRFGKGALPGVVLGATSRAEQPTYEETLTAPPIGLHQPIQLGWRHHGYHSSIHAVDVLLTAGAGTAMTFRPTIRPATGAR